MKFLLTFLFTVEILLLTGGYQCYGILETQNKVY